MNFKQNNIKKTRLRHTTILWLKTKNREKCEKCADNLKAVPVNTNKLTVDFSTQTVEVQKIENAERKRC